VTGDKTGQSEVEYRDRVAAESHTQHVNVPAPFLEIATASRIIPGKCRESASFLNEVQFTQQDP
jgi:hypothetical protein